MKKIENKKERGELIPLSMAEVMAGFPSPADDFLEATLDLNEYLVRNPTATFMVRVSGYSMTGAGIYPRDVLVVDRSLQADHNRIIIAVVDGELTVKRIVRTGDGWMLVADNPKYPAIRVTGNGELVVWGVVVAVIRRMEGV